MKSISWLDFKLGLRMLIKYPWLTIAGGLGMAVAIAIGAAFFGIISAMTDPSVPLDEGDRIVSIQMWENSDSRRPSLHDFAAWHGRLETVPELGAARNVSRNVIGPNGQAELTRVAEMTASSFRITREKPLLGRYFTEDDERATSPPVVVLSYDLWRTHFPGDSALAGETLQLGNTKHQVIGVMPKGFAFPVNHRLWVPLRLNPADYEPGKAPAVNVFGRLANNVSIEQSSAELARAGQRMAAQSPATHKDVTPRVWPYTYPFFEVDDAGATWYFHLFKVSISMLLVLICANVAVLVYARTVTRMGEMAVRNALGASRGRIIAQLFVEGLVLAMIAAVMGVLIARWALRQIAVSVEQTMGPLPFWMRPELNIGTLLYVVGLAALAAVIIGALPAMKVSGRRVEKQLRQLSGGTGMKLGRTWSILIIAQVGFAVALLPGTLYNTWQFAQLGFSGPGFAAQDYLRALLTMERETPTSSEAVAYEREFARRFHESQSSLMSGLQNEPRVAIATFSLSNPGEESTAMVEVEGVPVPNDSVNYSLGEGTRRGYGVRPNRVAINFFDAFEIPMLAGRPFQETERDSANTSVIVNQAFVREILGKRNAIGRKVRFVGRGGDSEADDAPVGRWFEIVGVVGDFPPNDVNTDGFSARIYLPPSSKQWYTTLLLRMNDRAPTAFAARLKQLSAAADPSLQLREIKTLAEEMTEEQRVMRLIALALLLTTVSVLLLTAGGIYALMSVAVTQRRREIGVRAALGADPRRILSSIFSRATRQLVIGGAVGLAVAVVLDRLMWGELMRGHGAIILPVVAAVMLTV
ncbi:MAG TPA: ABC transporter permease, partial [Longimicrobiales bacterium]